jgi:hypothetical protein
MARKGCIAGSRRCRITMSTIAADIAALSEALLNLSKVPAGMVPNCTAKMLKISNELDILIEQQRRHNEQIEHKFLMN